VLLQVMGHTVTRYAGGTLKVAATYQGEPVSEYVPGQPIALQITGIPASALIAVRASGQLGWFTNLSKGLALQVNKTGTCPALVVDTASTAPTGSALTTAAAVWTAPCVPSVPSVTFTVLWANGVGGKTYTNMTDITIARNTKFDCFQALGKSMSLAWKLEPDKAKPNITIQMNYSGYGWIAMGLGATSDALNTSSTCNQMVACGTNRNHTAVIYLPEDPEPINEYVLTGPAMDPTSGPKFILGSKMKWQQLRDVAQLHSPDGKHMSMTFTRPLANATNPELYPINSTGTNSIMYAYGSAKSSKQFSIHEQADNVLVDWRGPQPPKPSPPPSPNPSPPPGPAPAGKCDCCDRYCETKIPAGYKEKLDLSLSWRLNIEAKTVHIVMDTAYLGWIGLGIAPPGKVIGGMSDIWAVIGKCN